MSNKRRTFLKNTGLGLLAASLVRPKNKGIHDSSKKTKIDQSACEMTTTDYFGEGPFYSDDPPEISEYIQGSESSKGNPLVISGRVLNLECSEYIPDTIIDVWHADHQGQYDNTGFNFRGFTRTNDQGFYLFKTIVPGKYLNGTDFRPSHIHFKVKPPNFPQLTTQLYFEGDDKIPGDAAASIDSGTFDATNRIIPLNMNSIGVMEGQFDIVIDGNGISVGTQEIHLNTGMIYSASPNPFQNSLTIKYGVFKKSNVGIKIYNVEGIEIAELEDRMMSAEKYEAIWNPSKYLQPGYYFISISINNVHVHYLKVLKE